MLSRSVKFFWLPWLQQKTKQALEYVEEADGVVGGFEA